jgi:hypothetical protein
LEKFVYLVDGEFEPHPSNHGKVGNHKNVDPKSLQHKEEEIDSKELAELYLPYKVCRVGGVSPI